MKDFPFSFDRLTKFSQSDPYAFIPAYRRSLYEELKFQEKRLRFPAINSDIGSLLAFLLGFVQPRRIFEMGSGYGHSAFWYFLGSEESLEEVVLTEKRSDLLEVFQSLSWPESWKSKMNYRQEDAFETLDAQEGKFDMFLIDGVKADYERFLEAAWPKLSKNGFVAIDNSFWRGSFLDKNVREGKVSAARIARLHELVSKREDMQAVFVPYADGLTLIKKSL